MDLSRQTASGNVMLA